MPAIRSPPPLPCLDRSRRGVGGPSRSSGRSPLWGRPELSCGSPPLARRLRDRRPQHWRFRPELSCGSLRNGRNLKPGIGFPNCPARAMTGQVGPSRRWSKPFSREYLQRMCSRTTVTHPALLPGMGWRRLFPRPTISVGPIVLAHGKPHPSGYPMRLQGASRQRRNAWGWSGSPDPRVVLITAKRLFFVGARCPFVCMTTTKKGGADVDGKNVGLPLHLRFLYPADATTRRRGDPGYRD